MGWRAIRFCLAQPDIFKTQLRAILRASAHGNVKIMYPMVSNVDEVMQANAFLEEAKDELRQRGVPFNEDIEVGVMIEVPVGRDHRRPDRAARGLLQPRHERPGPVHAGRGPRQRARGLPLRADAPGDHPADQATRSTSATSTGSGSGICGEMAGNPLMAPLLMGLGVDEFSMSPSAVPLVKDVIRSLRFAEAEDLAAKALAVRSAAEVLEPVPRADASRWRRKCLNWSVEHAHIEPPHRNNRKEHDHVDSVHICSRRNP